MKKDGRTKHGMHNTRTYHAWENMRSRCNNKKFHQYADYGGRGIRVCERWNDFRMFFADMGEVPDGMTLERKNVNGDYQPDNCVWVTRTEQQNNLRNSRLVEFNSERLTIANWARKLGINKNTLRYRLKNWPIEKALSK